MFPCHVEQMQCCFDEQNREFAGLGAGDAEVQGQEQDLLKEGIQQNGRECLEGPLHDAKVVEWIRRICMASRMVASAAPFTSFFLLLESFLRQLQGVTREIAQEHVSSIVLMPAIFLQLSDASLRPYHCVGQQPQMVLLG